LSLIDEVVVFGVLVVLPLALGGAWWRWGIAGVATVAALELDRGAVAAALVVPWLVVAGSRVLAGVQAAGPLLFWTRADVVRVIAGVYAAVAAAALVQSRSGVHLFGLREPIVELTAVHYTYAGTAALMLAGATTPGRWSNRAIACTAAAPPIVALGFVTGWAMPQVGGAALMAAGVWTTAALQLVEAAGHRPVQRGLLSLSGLAIWAPMVLAVGWAAGQHWDVPYLAIHDMARLHGVPNAIGFCLAGLIARQEVLA